MKLSLAFTHSIELLILCNYLPNKVDIVNSKVLSEYMDVSPLLIRRYMTYLSNNGIIRSRLGHGGIEFIKPFNEITLYDVYIATDDDNDDSSFLKFLDNRDFTESQIKMQADLKKDFEDVKKVFENKLKEYKVIDYYDDYVSTNVRNIVKENGGYAFELRKKRG